MHKKIIYFSLLFIFLSSCGDTWSSVKRGLTGTKANSADEFLVKKKDPLIMPPDFENLPTPDDKMTDAEEESIFQETIELSKEESGSLSNSVESSILRKIQSKLMILVRY